MAESAAWQRAKTVSFDAPATCHTNPQDLMPDQYTPRMSLRARLFRIRPHAAEWWLYAGMVICLLMLRITLWPIETTDTTYFFLRWHDLLIRHGRLLALKQPISDYFPAFFELTVLTSFLEPHVSRLGQIKLLPFCFDLLSAGLAVALAAALQLANRQMPQGAGPRIAAFFVILAGPTVILNGSLWGQTDIIFTFWMLLAVYFCVSGRGAYAPLAYGMAFAFKLQSVFLAPFFLAMLLRRRIPAWSLILLPVGWLLALLPPLLVGGSPWAFLRLPFTQATELPALAINVANPWEAANLFHLDVPTGLRIGLVFTAVAAAVLTALGMRRGGLRPRAIAALAALSLLAMPYIMPRMHDRYFFPAEVLLSILACVDLAFLAPAALVISSSLICYTMYFINEPKHRATAIAAVGTTLALFAVTRHFLRLSAGDPLADELEMPEEHAVETRAL